MSSPYKISHGAAGDQPEHRWVKIAKNWILRRISVFVMPLHFFHELFCCRIYMDYNATTPLHREVLRAMRDAMVWLWKNPSSSYGEVLQLSRQSINQSIDNHGIHMQINQSINQSMKKKDLIKMQLNQSINQSNVIMTYGNGILLQLI